MFSVARHARDGMVDDEMRRRMRLLVPHVRRSAMISKLINLSRVEAAAMADTLDGLQAGMFLVDAAGRLVHANVSGRAMLDDGNVLHANGRPVAPEIHADEVLSDVFVAASHGDRRARKKAWRRGSRRAMATGSSPTCCRSPRAYAARPARPMRRSRRYSSRRPGKTPRPAVEMLARAI